MNHHSLWLFMRNLEFTMVTLGTGKNQRKLRLLKPKARRVSNNRHPELCCDRC